MADEKKCFVIMPITTPAPMVEKYPGGEEHFQHVYDHLFKPCIVKAGYAPIPPKTQGSDLIHAGIVGNLESADLVLCDMSCLNPNVFFEWGIRTALNKPVCIVKDELATNVPFDIGILNYQEYNSTLHGWEIEAEREKLTAHLTASVAKAGNENALWKYFGLSSKGQPYQVQEGSGDKLDYIAMQMESLSRKMDSMDDRIRFRKRGRDWPSPETVNNAIAMALPSGSGIDFRVYVDHTQDGVPRVLIRPDPTWDNATKTEVADAAAETLGMAVGFMPEMPRVPAVSVRSEKPA